MTNGAEGGEGGGGSGGGGGGGTDDAITGFDNGGEVESFESEEPLATFNLADDNEGERAIQLASLTGGVPAMGGQDDPGIEAAGLSSTGETGDSSDSSDLGDSLSQLNAAQFDDKKK